MAYPRGMEFLSNRQKTRDASLLDLPNFVQGAYLGSPSQPDMIELDLTSVYLSCPPDESPALTGFI